MTLKLKTSLAVRILNLIIQKHKKTVYIYTLGEVAAMDEEISVDMRSVQKSEIKLIEKCFGEAQVEMLYETSDAAVVGVGMSQGMKHAIFIEHFEHNVNRELRIRLKPSEFKRVTKG